MSIFKECFIYEEKKRINSYLLDPNFDFNYEDDDSDEEILTKCLKCGFEEPVPSLIYEKFHKELGKRVVTLNCQRCDTEKFIPKKYFKD